MIALVGAPPRIAVLEADIPMPELQAKYGRYGDIFTRLLNAGATAASLPTPQITSWDIMDHPEKYPDPSEYDAILVTGSRYSAYEDKSWIHILTAYVKRIYEEFPSKKIIGICFGHQIVAQALGGKVELNQRGWELAVRRIIMSESAKGIFDLKDASMRLQQMHRDIVTVAPPGSTVIGSNDNCACQAMIIPDRVLSVQGHPEFNRDIVEFLLDNRFGKGLFSRDEYDEAFPRAADEDDGVKIGEGIMNFLLGVTA